MIYDYVVTTGKGGEELNLAEFKGKVILIVNTATGCGFTPQYESIEKLYRDYHKKGLEILETEFVSSSEIIRPFIFPHILRRARKIWSKAHYGSR